METLDEFLEHHGIKGMKWGVRRASTKMDVIRPPQSIVVKTVPGKKVKTTGGKHHSATEEAIATAIAKQKAKKSSTHSLTNKELQAAVQRMQLEQQFTQLNHSTKSAGGKFVDQILGRSGNMKAEKAARRESSAAVRKAFTAGKAALTVAAA
jgi:hypothetical protein